MKLIVSKNKTESGNSITLETAKGILEEISRSRAENWSDYMQNDKAKEPYSQRMEV